jgi:uncharacterized membrane protein
MFKKKSSTIGIVVLTLAVFFGGAFGMHNRALGQSNQDEKIISFSSNLHVRSDAGMDLTETIVYDFGKLERHGIFRVLRTQNAADKKMDVDVISVADAKGIPYTFTTSRDGEDLSIKIGDADKTITGTHTYVIKYDLTNVATYFDDHDEFTWNVIGSEWNIPVLAASATVQFPAGATSQLSAFTFDCYRGSYGATGTCANKKLVPANEPGNTSGAILALFADQNLEAGQDLTISVGLPKNIITPANEPFDFTIFFWILPILVFLRLVTKALQKRRDLKPNKTIIAEYEAPEGMMPTLVGAVADGTVHNRDMTAGLISAAEQGFVKINRIEKKWFLGSADYELTLLKPLIALPQVTEQKIVEYFMENKNVGETIALSKLDKMKFVKHITELKKSVYDEMIKRGLFTKNPTNRKVLFAVLGIVMLFAGIVLGAVLGSFNAAFAIILTAIMVFIWPFLVSVRTIAGADVRRHILGFKKFISVTDKERLEFHNAPEKNPEQFMKFLPFAIALGVEEKWAKQFEGIYMAPPAWYGGSDVAHFTAATFVRDMALFTAYSNTAAMHAGGGAASSGGGFSGGGGGGGGGGSW